MPEPHFILKNKLNVAFRIKSFQSCTQLVFVNNLVINSFDGTYAIVVYTNYENALKLKKCVLE